jgi:hypothetical protein
VPLALAALPLAYDAYVFLGIRGGRDAFLARAGEPSLAFGVVGLALLVTGIGLHAVLAARAVRSVSLAHACGHATVGNRKLQQWSALFVLVFLAAHQRHSIFVAGIEGIGGSGLYERIRNDCDGYGFLATYVVGIAALALHLGQGGLAVAMRGCFAPEATRRMIAASSVLVAVLTFFALTNALAAYTLGAPLFFGP